ncbi:MAG: entericidin A/B family lipoprotein [Phycisphaerales bacterium]|jgi:predicted small secreted protein
MHRNRASILLLLVLGAVAIVMSACNTTKGVGEDIQKAGEGLKDSASRNGAD